MGLQPGHVLSADLFAELAAIETDDCVEWPRNTDADGYGQFKTGGKNIRCGRAALAMRIPPPSPRHHAAHGPCHNPRCMNYRHLTWKTSSANQYDRERDGTDLRGEQHGRAILTEAQVMDARRRHRAGEAIGALAREMGVSRGGMRSVVHGVTWRHLPTA